jgi:hypothetical protein
MPWGKVDDKLHSSVKWRRASKPARALWTTALSWCSDHPSDGFVPEDMLALLDGTKSEAAVLVKVGLWDRSEGGWTFHDWSDHNPDAASVKATRSAKSEGGRRGNHTKWHVRRGTRVDGCEFCESDMRSDKRVASESSRPDPTRPIKDSDATDGFEGSPYVTREHEPHAETASPETVLPRNLTPGNRHKAYALENALDLREELDAFRDHARANGRTAVDWDAALMGWLRQSVKRGRPGTSNRRVTPDDRINDHVQLVARLSADDHPKEITA